MVTEEMLIEQFIESKWKEITVICPDGVKLYITPCSYTDNITGIKDVEYFLVEGDLPYLGGSTLNTIINSINNHAELVKEAVKEKIELLEYYDKHHQNWDEDEWSYYSDWHKDVYGYRPSKDYAPGIYINPTKR